MSESTITFVCYYCGHATDDANDVMPSFGEDSVFKCVDNPACQRRQRRNYVLAEMKEMAKKPHVHPVDKFSRAAVLTCGIFMGAVSAFGLSYLWFGV